jgi:hypothetical protein
MMTIDEVYAEPCHCILCPCCGGTGTVYSLDQSEPCEECSHGILETCESCQLLQEE